MSQITFSIHFHTRAGERLEFELRSRSDAPGARTRVPMEHVGDGWWRGALERGALPDSVEYRYRVMNASGEVRREPAFRPLAPCASSALILDAWLPAELPEGAFLRQAFAGVIFQPGSDVTPQTGAGLGPEIILTLRCARIEPGRRICVSGSHPALGSWNPERAVVMSSDNYPLWQVTLPRLVISEGAEYKFGIWDDQQRRLVSFEDGANRRLGPVYSEAADIVVNAELYGQRAPWKGAGVAIPVFALRSERGFGVGEFADLAPFAEWAAACGMHLVQVLPVNDTSSDFSWKDSYPYKAISTAALHPIYLSLDGLASDLGLALPQDYYAERQALNQLPQLDYERVLHGKLRFVRGMFDEVWAEAVRDATFEKFVETEAEWLKPYAVFCTLRDRHGTASFQDWGKDAAFSAKRLTQWFQPRAKEHREVMFHAFVQFHLRRQLDRALAAGHARGVAFKGDLPIGIDRCSVEAWSEPDLFRMDRQTGAPPDPFSALGQNWGFPTYDWPRMAGDGYAWWQKRLHRMSASFDALRIDHILGFFRIWEIPCPHPEGILGHFNPALPLTPQEIRAAGCGVDPAAFARAALPDDAVDTFFGAQAGEVRDRVLSRDAEGWWRLREGFEAGKQRLLKLRKLFPAEVAATVDASLQRFGYEVLFLEDPDQPRRYHPRIAMDETAVFRAMGEHERTALKALHDDFFYRRHGKFWEEEAMKKLPALMDATRMLICGEDLGMIPDAVPVVLNRLGLFSLEVQSMPKRLGQRFGNPKDYPYMSVCTTSTHDTQTLRGLWEEDAALRQDFYRDVMQLPGEAPRDCMPAIARFVVWQNLAAASMWCILPLQDWLALDGNLRRPVASEERINVPAISRHYWRYRMHLPIEALAGAAEFTRQVAELIRDAGR